MPDHTIINGFEVADSSVKWKLPPVPRSAVQTIPIDAQGLILTQHRGPNNRSARNVWSWPTGLHRIGESVYECSARELREEVSLTPVIKPRIIGMYENIAGDADDETQFHWLITLMACKVENIAEFKSNEPNKYDRFELLPCTCFVDPEFWNRFNYHESFTKLAMGNVELVEKLKAVANASY